MHFRSILLCCSYTLLSVLALLPTGCGSGDVAPRGRFTRQIEWADEGVWLKSDLHLHTHFSTGGLSMNELASKAAANGCDVIAVTDNAGQEFSAHGEGYSRAISAARELRPSLVILSGLEWNVPPSRGDQQAIVLFPPGAGEFFTLDEFRARFDDWGTKESSREQAEEALRWLSNTQKDGVSPVVISLAPSRHGESLELLTDQITRWKWSDGAYAGFSGSPGHQAADQPGAYPKPTPLIDRWDPAVAVVGGVWDTLLKQDTDVWGASASSGFAAEETANAEDYLPGQFSETWIYAPTRTEEGVLQALQAGSYFGVLGRIAREVELEVDAPGLPRSAIVGEAIEVPADSIIRVKLSAIVPEKDWAGATNRIDEVELIVVQSDGTRSLLQKVPASNKVEVSVNLTVPTGGLVIRARGRRVMENDSDLLFYTNPIRVRTLTDESSLPSAMSTPAESLLAVAFGLIGLLAVTAVAVGFRKARFRSFRSGTSAATTAWSTGPPDARHFRQAAILVACGIGYFALLPFHWRAESLDEVRRHLAQIPVVDFQLAEHSAWMVSLTGYVLLSFLLMGALTLDVRRKGLQVMAALFVPIASVLLQSVLLVIRCWTDPFPESLMPLLAAAWGSFAGVLLWLATGSYAVHSFRHFLQTDSRRAVIDWLATTTVVAIVIFAWLPFDLVSSLNMLSAKTDAGELTLIPFRDTTSISWSLLAGTVAAFPIGVFAGTVGTRGKRSARSVSESLPIGLLILAGVELVQVFIRSQPASTTDVLAGIPGVIAGAWWLGYSRSPLPGQVRAALHQAGYLRFLTYELMTILYVVFLCGILWGPFHFNSSQSSVNEELAGILSLPFQKLYPRGEYAPLAKVILFIPLGASLGQLVGSIAIPPGVRKILQKMAFVLCLCLGIGIELIQAFFQPYRPSLDDVLFYAVGAFIGMALAARLAMARR